MIDSKQWSPSDGIYLEPNAQRVVCAELHGRNNLIVSAGPGTGKTELLAQRANFLLQTGFCPYPRRILAISFKRDAARNLKDRVRQRCGASLASRLDSRTFHAFAKQLVDNYSLALDNPPAPDYAITTQKTCNWPHEITFDELICLATNILRFSKYAIEALRQTYTHIFLDEFQDTTKAQYELLKSAFGKLPVQITAVGDANQTVMAWAGAMNGIQNTFRDDFNAEHVRLYLNHRSQPRLQRLQSLIVEHIDHSVAATQDPIEGTSGSIQVLHFADSQEEARGLTDIVEEWTKSGTALSEIAVLVRQTPKAICSDLVRELTRRGLACRNEQELQDLTSEPIVELAFDLLRVIAGSHEPSAYERLMRVTARRGLSDEAASRYNSRVREFLNFARRRVQAQACRRIPPEMLERIVHSFLCLVSKPALLSLSPAYHQGHRMGKLIARAKEAFESEFCIDSNICAALNRLSQDAAVRISTIHKAKGLEFQKVILLGVEEETFWLRPGEDPKVKLWPLFFVAASRAKSELVLTYADRRLRPPDYQQWRWDESRRAKIDFLACACQAADS